jgi:CNT family concentrative nucleoside transporter
MAAGFVVHSLIGFFLLHVIAWAFSENRRTVAWRPVVAGMLLSFRLGVVLLKAPYVKDVFLALNGALNALEKATQDGTSFVFGFLGGGPRSPKPIRERASCSRSGRGRSCSS